MATMGELKEEIQMLKNEKLPWQTRFNELVHQRTDELDADQKLDRSATIQTLKEMIIDSNKNILEKQKLIIDKEKQITANKRLEQGETPASSITFYLFLLSRPLSLVYIFVEDSCLKNFIVSDVVALVWSTFATFGGWFLQWIWPVQFKTTYPDPSDGLYLFVHLNASFTLVTNGFVE